MTRWHVSGLLLMLATSWVGAQDRPEMPAAPDAIAPAVAIQGPQLAAARTDWPLQGKCGKKQLEWARIGLDVAEDGALEDVRLRDSSTPAVNQMALDAVRDDRYTPAQQNGQPVRVRGIVLVELHTCTGKVKQADGTKTEQVWLESAPKQSFWMQTRQPFSPVPQARFGGSGAGRPHSRISAPVPVSTPNAEFTSEARRDRVQGEVLVTLMVDANGMPQDPQVVEPLPAGLTDAALAAVSKYRFRPALRDGETPVPVMITVAVNFRLY